MNTDRKEVGCEDVHWIALEVDVNLEDKRKQRQLIN
jgi:hypothetical protein